MGEKEMTLVNLREVDKVEVTVLVDNYTDLLLMQGTDVVKRPSVAPPLGFLAEHGFSCLIKTAVGSEEHTVLMDVGITGTCLLHNARILKVDLGQVEALVLSHGHFDHSWGLREVLPKLPKGIPLVLHPDAFLPRRLNLPAINRQSVLPPPDEDLMKDVGVEVRRVRGDSTLAAGCLLVLGEIERMTGFEKGMPGAEAEVKGEWVKDPFLDDRGVAVKVKDKGLVVISGCAHAGIINTVKHAQKVTGTPKVHAVIGGFHLTGPMMEPVIGPTIEEMRKIEPVTIVPTHCTGWKAINQFAKEMPGPFVLNTVGTTYIFN
jgi:7,8-dihydropterin-6-yl-methyl-4-(beta-D-ribofuranosyl)aminobenzene 5'-phosphate synthase